MTNNTQHDVDLAIIEAATPGPWIADTMSGNLYASHSASCGPLVGGMRSLRDVEFVRHFDPVKCRQLVEENKVMRESEEKYEALVDHHAVFYNPNDAWENSKAWEERCKELEAQVERFRSASDSAKHYLADLRHGVAREEAIEDALINELEDAIFSTPVQSLAAVRREAMDEMKSACLEEANICLYDSSHEWDAKDIVEEIKQGILGINIEELLHD